ncbi:hypothetical protein PR048_004495 [Dryococelus australis]|uniref:DUF4817 domain-containing protein n=1 Tax=Dryococelus australis TaxID=614101 RepID=A0ABQ9I6D6_9NEOP|nr:hypothetical protein PR048_004495 [Dryococelus australis]
MFAEYTAMILVYGTAEVNRRTARRLYQERYPQRAAPTHVLFATAMQRLQEQDTFTAGRNYCGKLIHNKAVFWLSGYTASLSLRRPGFNPRLDHSWNFVIGNRAERCHWPAGFFWDIPFSPPLHSGVAPFSPHFTLIGSQDLVLNSRPNLSTQLKHDIPTRHTHFINSDVMTRDDYGDQSPSRCHSVSEHIQRHSLNVDLCGTPATMWFTNLGKNRMLGRSRYSCILDSSGILRDKLICKHNPSIVPDYAAGRQVSSGLSQFPRPCFLALLHTHFTSPSMALKTSIALFSPHTRLARWEFVASLSAWHPCALPLGAYRFGREEEVHYLTPPTAEASSSLQGLPGRARGWKEVGQGNRSYENSWGNGYLNKVRRQSINDASTGDSQPYLFLTTAEDRQRRHRREDRHPSGPDTFDTTCDIPAIVGKWFGDAGLCDVSVEFEIVAEGPVNSVFEGWHYNRDMLLHKIVYEAFQQCCEYYQDKKSLIEVTLREIDDFSQNQSEEIQSSVLRLSTFEETAVLYEKFQKEMRENARSTASLNIKEMKTTRGNVETVLMAENQLFARMFLLASSRKLDMKEVLKHPLGPLPCALANCDGSLKMPNKCALELHIEQQTLPQVDGVNKYPSTIIDGVAMIYKTNGENQTFSEISEILLKTTLQHGKKSDHVDVVFYVYQELHKAVRETEVEHLLLKSLFRKIASDLGSPVTLELPGLHAFTGCDTINSFPGQAGAGCCLVLGGGGGEETNFDPPLFLERRTRCPVASLIPLGSPCITDSGETCLRHSLSRSLLKKPTGGARILWELGRSTQRAKVLKDSPHCLQDLAQLTIIHVGFLAHSPFRAHWLQKGLHMNCRPHGMWSVYRKHVYKLGHVIRDRKRGRLIQDTHGPSQIMTGAAPKGGGRK